MNKELNILKRTVWDAESSPLSPAKLQVGRGPRLSQHQNGISGCASLLAGVLLLAVLVLEAKEAIITGCKCEAFMQRFNVPQFTGVMTREIF